MRQCFTAVIERAEPLGETFATEPYEGGWAEEAVLFIRTLEGTDPTTILRARVQISPDGIHWVDEGTDFPPLAGEGLVFARIGRFGNWLRVAGTVEGTAPARALVYVVLKG
jgi:hypothetical protein